MRTLSLAACLIAVVMSPASASSSNAVKQFSTTTNTDSSTWSYRASDGNGDDGNYALLSSVGSLAAMKNGKSITLPVWITQGQPFNVPLFWANKGKIPVTVVSNGQTINIPGKTLIYHPGYNGVAAVLSLLAAKAGTATVNYDFTHLDWSCGSEGVGIGWSIEKNFGNGALASGHLYSTDAQHIATTRPQTTSVAVAAGDRINFIINGANPPFCDSTGITATVSVR